MLTLLQTLTLDVNSDLSTEELTVNLTMSRAYILLQD